MGAYWRRVGGPRGQGCPPESIEPLTVAGRMAGVQPVGWVERSDTHRRQIDRRDGFRKGSTHPTSSSTPCRRIAFAVEPFPPKLSSSPASVPAGPVEAESDYAQTGKLPDREDLRSHEAEESHQARDRRGDR